MAEKESMIKPPYPMIGEACQLVTGAFDTKSTDPQRRKELDRVVREGDFDWSRRHAILNDLLIQPLQKFDADFGAFVGRFVEFLLDSHIEMLLRVSLDALSRDESAPLLIHVKYAAHVAAFLGSLKDQFGGPDLGDFMRPDANPIEVVFRWAEQSLHLQVGQLAYPGDKQKRDDIGRWRRGKTIPDFFGSIQPLTRELTAQCPRREADIRLFSKWLVTARALAWLDRAAIAAGYGSLLGLVRKEILLNCPPRDVGVALSKANIKAGQRLAELTAIALPLLNLRLARTRRKEPGDQAEARRELEHFAAMTDRLAPGGHTRYFLDWCEGRWHVLAGAEDKALEFYERAADGALYRAGENQKQILQEAISLAAHLRKKAPLKRLKHRALAFGLFSNLFSELPEEPEVVSDWEVRQLAQAFTILFPAQARFREAPTQEIHTSFPFRVIDQEAADRLKPDLTSPNRVISIPMRDGEKYRSPQLIWFASAGRGDCVRLLLEAGADVNKLDHQGGSALLCALQHADATGQRQTLDLLLEHPHKKDTLDQLTARKRLSPLYLAVLLGDPDVVARLLEMGATADLPASYPPQTPLYICIERLAVFRAGFAKQRLLHRLAFPSQEDLEIHRRHSGGWAGVMGDHFSNPRSPFRGRAGMRMMNLAADGLVRKTTRVPREHFLKVAELLVQHGADPNRKHSWPAPGRTPLMLAAESDSEDAFRLLVEAGGNPRLTDDQGNDCRAIARGFGSGDVLAYLAGTSSPQ